MQTHTACKKTRYELEKKSLRLHAMKAEGMLRSLVVQADNATEDADCEESKVKSVSEVETEVVVSEASDVTQQKEDSGEKSCVGCGGESTSDDRETHAGQNKQRPS